MEIRADIFIAMTGKPPVVRALKRFGLNSPNAARLQQFYEHAVGAQVTTRIRLENNVFAAGSKIVGGVASSLLGIGDATIELWECDARGRPYPPDLSPYDTRFQHLALVVNDMQLAMERLSQTVGWSAISAGGPQQLPDRDGGVIAFKFRDPDGHPLELLQFAAGKLPAHWQAAVRSDNHLGIDHSALGVADARRSVRFYESLGLRPSSRTLNRGPAQERLDGVSGPVVDVIGLAPHRSTPHVELLHYRTASRPTHDALAMNDDAATRLIFAVESASGPVGKYLAQDPDGHFLQFE